jgi:RNA-directed DNA polymerase
VDLDIKGFFDSIDHELLLKALRKHTDCRWVLLYVERWLKAPMQLEDGRLEPRTAGTPQGGVISPLLANLFLHYVFDLWMTKTHPHILSVWKNCEHEQFISEGTMPECDVRIDDHLGKVTC